MWRVPCSLASSCPRFAINVLFIFMARDFHGCMLGSIGSSRPAPQHWRLTSPAVFDNDVMQGPAIPDCHKLKSTLRELGATL